MQLRQLLAIVAVSVASSLAFTLPAAAQSRDSLDAAFDRINPETLFKGLIREDDVSLLFQHLRESIAANARGEEAVQSEAMKRRSEQLQREVAARGSVLVAALLTALESAARQAVREGLNDFNSRPSRESLFPR